MARLSELPTTFMQNFLARNPNSFVDSNGYLASEYREELARREKAAQEPQVSTYDPARPPQFNGMYHGMAE